MTESDHFALASDAWEKEDLEVAFNEFLLGAKEGDSSCQVNLGLFYDTGLHVAADQKKALYWYRQAYQQGDCSGANNIATIWRDNGYPTKALWWYRRAVALGDGDALVEVAAIYEQGIGVNKSPKIANRYYKQALSHQCISEAGLEHAEVGFKRTKSITTC